VQKVETYASGQPVHLNPVGGGGTEFGQCLIGSMSTEFCRRPSSF